MVLIYAAAVLFVILVVALVKLKRVKELHHGYYGAVIAAVGHLRQHEWMLWVGVLLLLDDTIQHVTEVVWGKARYYADFTPVHRIGAYLMGINWKNTGWVVPVAFAVIVGAAAIFCALYFGV